LRLDVRHRSGPVLRARDERCAACRPARGGPPRRRLWRRTRRANCHDAGLANRDADGRSANRDIRPDADRARQRLPGTFTTDDVAIAKIIKDSAADAIPKLGTVASLSLEKQTALFMPARAWIQAQLDHVAGLSPSSCTKDAVDVFNDAMGRYRNLAQDFLDWREWGAAGLP